MKFELSIVGEGATLDEIAKFVDAARDAGAEDDYGVEVDPTALTITVSWEV
jgi:hypothetical protein